MLELHVFPQNAKCDAVTTYVCPLLWFIAVLELSHEVRDSCDLLHASSDLFPVLWLCLSSAISSETVKFLVGFCQRVSRCSFGITVVNRQGRGSSCLFQGEEIRLSEHGIYNEQLLVLGVLLDIFMSLSPPLYPSACCACFWVNYLHTNSWYLISAIKWDCPACCPIHSLLPIMTLVKYIIDILCC